MFLVPARNLNPTTQYLHLYACRRKCRGDFASAQSLPRGSKRVDTRANSDFTSSSTLPSRTRGQSLKFLVDRMPKTLEVDKTSSSGNEQNGRGRLVNASERAASGVGDSLRQGSGMRAITSANSDTGAARLRAAVQRMELTAVAASSARARRRSPKSSTPFWTVHLRADELKSSVPFTSQSPPAFVLSSTLEYVVQDAAATLSRAEAQLHKLTATDGTLGPTVATLDADGNQLDPDAFRMLVASGYRGKNGNVWENPALVGNALSTA